MRPGSPTGLVYINLTDQTVQNVPLPDKFTALLEDQPEIAVSKGGESSRFALLFSQKNRIFAFENTADTTPNEIKLSEGVRLNQTGRIAAASFSGDTFVLYAGVSNDLGEGEVAPPTAEEEEENAGLKSYLFEYDKAGKLTKSFTLPEKLEAQALYKLGNDFYASDQPYGFGFYHDTGGELQHVYTITEMGSWMIVNNKAYVEAAGTLYEFKPGEKGTFSLRSLSLRRP
jgi:hypothetical protein